MARSIPTEAFFRSDAFNNTQPRPYFIDECCFGDDVARWLARRLSESGATAKEPDQEDFGWHLSFSVGGKEHWPKDTGS